MRPFPVILHEPEREPRPVAVINVDHPHGTALVMDKVGRMAIARIGDLRALRYDWQDYQGGREVATWAETSTEPESWTAA